MRSPWALAPVRLRRRPSARSEPSSSCSLEYDIRPRLFLFMQSATGDRALQRSLLGLLKTPIFAYHQRSSRLPLLGLDEGGGTEWRDRAYDTHRRRCLDRHPGRRLLPGRGSSWPPFRPRVHDFLRRPSWRTPTSPLSLTCSRWSNAPAAPPRVQGDQQRWRAARRSSSRPREARGEVLGTAPDNIQADDGDPPPVQGHDLKRDLADHVTRYQTAWSELEEMGAVLKDPRTGLVDFYGDVDGKRVWLCKEVVTARRPSPTHHGLHEGFGRAQGHRAGHTATGTSIRPRWIASVGARPLIDAFLRALGRDPGREPELAGTGERVAKAWADELLAGYAVDDGRAARGERPRGHVGACARRRDVLVADHVPAPPDAVDRHQDRRVSPAGAPPRRRGRRAPRRRVRAEARAPGAARRARGGGPREAPPAALGGVPHRPLPRVHDRAGRADARGPRGDGRDPRRRPRRRRRLRRAGGRAMPTGAVPGRRFLAALPLFPASTAALFPRGHPAAPRTRSALPRHARGRARPATHRCIAMAMVVDDDEDPPGIARGGRRARCAQDEALPDGRAHILLRAGWRASRLTSCRSCRSYRCARACVLVVELPTAVSGGGAQSAARRPPRASSPRRGAAISTPSRSPRRPRRGRHRRSSRAQYIVLDAEIRQEALEELDGRGAWCASHGGAGVPQTAAADERPRGDELSSSVGEEAGLKLVIAPRGEPGGRSADGGGLEWPPSG